MLAALTVGRLHDKKFCVPDLKRPSGKDGKGGGDWSAECTKLF